MSEVVRRQINRIVGPHAGDPCIPWDANQLPLFRDKERIPEELRPVAGEIVDRHEWVDKGCVSLTLPDRKRGEDLGQEVWLSVFEALVTPGREVRSLHPFIGGVMENRLIRLVARRTRDGRFEPIEIETPDGPMDHPELVDRQPGVEEKAWRASAMDFVLSRLDLFDRILVIGYAERTPLKTLREALIKAGDCRVTNNTPEQNIKTYQNTAIRRARELLAEPKQNRTTRRDKK